MRDMCAEQGNTSTAAHNTRVAHESDALEAAHAWKLRAIVKASAAKVVRRCMQLYGWTHLSDKGTWLLPATENMPENCRTDLLDKGLQLQAAVEDCQRYGGQMR